MIEQIGEALYQFEMLSGETVEIGDKEVADFKPHIKLSRWDGECFIKVGLPTKRESKPVIEGSKVKWIDKDIEAHFYALEPTTAVTKDKEGKDVSFRQNELGGFEFEVILKKKPKTNKIILNIEIQGLKFYYQPKLTPEEIADGAVRPDNVVGSYAVYHATRTNMHRTKEDADKYKCGKAFHIYRPKIIDANGNWVWGELNLDEQAGTLTTTIPQDFLDRVVYPVSTGTTNFGYEVKGAGSLSIRDTIRGTDYASGGAGTADSITAYIVNDDYFRLTKCGLYLASDLSLKGTTDELEIDPLDDWQAYDFSAPKPNIADDTYGLAAWSEDGTGTCEIYYDAISVTRYYKALTYNGFPDAFNGTHGVANYKYSIYCTYTPADGNVTVTPDVIAQTLTEYASILKEVTTPTTLSLSDTEYSPVLKFGIIPSTLALITTGFVPILKELLTPATLGLGTSAYIPIITISGSILVTPGILALILAGYIPVIIIPTIHRNVADDFWDWDYEPPVRVTITPLPDEIQFEEKK